MRRLLSGDVLIGLLSFGVPLLVYAQWSRGPALEAIARREARLSGGARELRALEITRERFAEFQRESDELDEKLSALEQIRPAEPRPEPFLERLRTVCREQRLDLLEAKALPPGSDTAPVEIRVKGTRPAFVSFLERLPRLPRLNRVDRIQMERREGGAFEFAVHIVTFYSKS